MPVLGDDVDVVPQRWARARPAGRRPGDQRADDGHGGRAEPQRDPGHDHERDVGPVRWRHVETRTVAPIAAAPSSTASIQRSRTRPRPAPRDREHGAADDEHAEPVADPPAQRVLGPRRAVAEQLGVDQPISPPSSGASATGSARKASRSPRRLRSGRRPRQAQSSSVAPSAGLAHVRGGPAERGRDAAAVAEIDGQLGRARAGEHERPGALRGVSTSAASVTPAAGKKTG